MVALIVGLALGWLIGRWRRRPISVIVRPVVKLEDDAEPPEGVGRVDFGPDPSEHVQRQRQVADLQ